MTGSWSSRCDGRQQRLSSRALKLSSVRHSLVGSAVGKEDAQDEKFFLSNNLDIATGGRGGIRTHEGLAPLAVFKTAALNRSATLPDACRGGIWGAPAEGVNWTPFMPEAQEPAVLAAFAPTGDAA